MVNPPIREGDCEQDCSENLLKPVVFLNKCKIRDIFEGVNWHLPSVLNKINSTCESSVFTYVAGYVARKTISFPVNCAPHI